MPKELKSSEQLKKELKEALARERKGTIHGECDELKEKYLGKCFTSGWQRVPWTTRKLERECYLTKVTDIRVSSEEDKIEYKSDRIIVCYRRDYHHSIDRCTRSWWNDFEPGTVKTLEKEVPLELFNRLATFTDLVAEEGLRMMNHKLKPVETTPNDPVPMVPDIPHIFIADGWSYLPENIYRIDTQTGGFYLLTEASVYYLENHIRRLRDPKQKAFREKISGRMGPAAWVSLNKSLESLEAQIKKWRAK